MTIPCSKPSFPSISPSLRLSVFPGSVVENFLKEVEEQIGIHPDDEDAVEEELKQQDAVGPLKAAVGAAIMKAKFAGMMRNKVRHWVDE